MLRQGGAHRVDWRYWPFQNHPTEELRTYYRKCTDNLDHQRHSGADVFPAQRSAFQSNLILRVGQVQYVQHNLHEWLLHILKEYPVHVLPEIATH